jgi:hypothetical protein
MIFDVLDLLALTQADMAELLGVSIRSDIKVLTRCVAVCAVAYRDVAEGARHRVETDLLIARNRAERARDVTPPADAGEDSDPAGLAALAA